MIYKNCLTAMLEKVSGWRILVESVLLLHLNPFFEIWCKRQYILFMQLVAFKWTKTGLRSFSFWLRNRCCCLLLTQSKTNSFLFKFLFNFLHWWIFWARMSIVVGLCNWTFCNWKSNEVIKENNPGHNEGVFNIWKLQLSFSWSISDHFFDQQNSFQDWAKF